MYKKIIAAKVNKDHIFLHYYYAYVFILLSYKDTHYVFKNNIHNLPQNYFIYPWHLIVSVGAGRGVTDPAPLP
jgi:hypothetical protein